MGVVKHLFGVSQPEKAPQTPLSPQDQLRESNRALADNPTKFAEWVSQYCIQNITPEFDLGLCPTDEQCERLQITKEQKEGCRREYSLMGALGACMCVGRNLPPSYYKVFKSEICAATAAKMYGIPSEGRIDEISSAIDRYIEDLSSDSHTSFSLTYLDRVYQGNPNQMGMYAVGIYQIPFQQLMFVFEAVRDAYCQLKTGLPSKAIEAFEKLGENNQGRMDSSLPADATV
jgi:hypothetical protein